MASLNSFKDLGGQKGDTYGDAQGLWEIMTVYSDGRYAWSLVEDAKGLSDAEYPSRTVSEILDYVRSLDRRVTLIENSITMLASMNEELRLMATIIGTQYRQMNGQTESVFEAVDLLRKITETNAAYIAANVPPALEAVESMKKDVASCVSEFGRMKLAISRHNGVGEKT